MYRIAILLIALIENVWLYWMTEFVNYFWIKCYKQGIILCRQTWIVSFESDICISCSSVVWLLIGETIRTVFAVLCNTCAHIRAVVTDSGLDWNFCCVFLTSDQFDCVNVNFLCHCIFCVFAGYYCEFVCWFAKKTHLENDVLCVEWDVKHCTLACVWSV